MLDLKTQQDVTRRSVRHGKDAGDGRGAKAANGHPGTPMALAPAGVHHLHEAPEATTRRTDWEDRDRFVLPPGTRPSCCIRCCTSPAMG